ncbi:MAG TPA: MlaD family protein [Puia sp.]|jgi:phospholipid/cholesterol/gamma-HCH transport system substrate-binding protein|nr:MlaD family protein [Puia sp.]
MKKNNGLKWKLGIFIVAGTVILVLGLFFIGKQKNLFVSVFPLKAIFKNVSGLKVGNNVRYGGIAVGTVEGIQLLTDSTVIVNMSIKSEVRKFIKEDASVGIGSEGLIGDRVILISPGTNNPSPVKDNEVLVTHAPLETEQILAGLKTSADNAALITQQLAEIAYKVNHGHGIISRLLGDSSLGNNLNATMANLKKGSAGLNENMEAAKHNFLLKGYFKKKKKEEDKKKKQLEDNKKEAEQKRKNDKDSSIKPQS